MKKLKMDKQKKNGRSTLYHKKWYTLHVKYFVKV